MMIDRSLTERDFAHAADMLGCHVAAIRALCEVESSGSGFNPNGTPVTLFEAHKFSRLTDGRFDATHPRLSSRQWDRSLYGKGWRAERRRLAEAIKLDREAALMATSWGLFQIMGFNYKLAGYEDVEAFVADMHYTERQHLMAVVSFLKNTGLDEHLRERRWSDLARGYNGAGFAENHWDTKLAAAFDRYNEALA